MMDIFTTSGEATSSGRENVNITKRNDQWYLQFQIEYKNRYLPVNNKLPIIDIILFSFEALSFIIINQGIIKNHFNENISGK